MRPEGEVPPVAASFGAARRTQALAKLRPTLMHQSTLQVTLQIQQLLSSLLTTFYRLQLINESRSFAVSPSLLNESEMLSRFIVLQAHIVEDIHFLR